MSDISPTSPQGPQGPRGPHDPSSGNAPEETKSKKGFHAKPMTFLGIDFNSDEATKFWQILIKSLGHEIDKERTKMIKAMKKMREDQEGKD